MPNFSKMMGNYPFNLIRGLGPTVKAAGIGLGVGGLYGGTGRRRSMGRSAIAGGALGAAGSVAYLNRDALSMAGRNIARNPSMVGKQLRGAGSEAIRRAGQFAKNIRRMM